MIERFNTAEEARELVTELRDRLKRMPYNPDLKRYCDNLDKMVSDLSSLEVEARRSRGVEKYKLHLTKLEKAVAHLQQLMLIHQLMS
jgi:polyhydroxyalkanoate synthesis regulator phasin